MEQNCHRCGTTVSRQDAFCPVCGAPQLHFDASEQPVFGEGTEPSATSGRPGQVNWKIVLGACAKIAVPAGVLCALPLLSPFSLLWVVGGATAVILLYRRKRPMTPLSARVGLRIGGLAGLMIAYASIAATALLRVVQRYPLHGGGSIDADYDEIIRQSMAYFQTTPDTQAQTRWFFHFMLTPDGRAAWSLMNMATVIVLTVLFASIGGAVGVRMFARRRAA
jgi:disulfide bond formation protein DsbB